MASFRWFVPAGGGDLMKLQRLEWQVGAQQKWADVPVVYEDPGDELIDCPVEHWDQILGGLCAVCLGRGQGRRADIEARMAAFPDGGPDRST